MNRFLEDHEYIDYQAGLIVSKTKELFDGAMSKMEKARAAYLFVRDEIPHSFDCNAVVITAAASEVLKHHTGICFAKANLLAALLRSQGIPAGFCYQHITLAQDDTEGYCLHCFNAILLDNRWLRVDTRGNTQEKNAQFSLGAPRLAYENRPQYDEYFFEGIFARPDARAMEMLKNAKNLRDVRKGLPEKPWGDPDIFA